jgi:two-component system, LytTR family, response regulator
MTTAALPSHPAPLHEPIADVPPAPLHIRTLIVDDQLVEREVMRRMLKSEPDIEIVGSSANGREAVEAIERLKPDVVFLDVQMPELDGFGVVSKLDPAQMPVIIFVTANHEFALKAFEVQALDYLIKPCGRDRFRMALERAREQIRRRQVGNLQQRLSELLASEARTTALRSPERLAVKSQGRILFLRSSDIDWVEAADNYVNLHVGRETHPLRDTMTSLEKRLPANCFLRISRSTIVNVEQIKELHSMLHGEHTVVLRNGTRLTLTRGYRGKLRQLGL